MPTARVIEAVEYWKMAVTEGQRGGLVRGDLPAMAIAAFNWAALHGLSMLLLDKRLDEDSSKALLGALRKVLCQGWQAR
jgi:hypothetical protein